jgi:hypothetical protein
MLPTVSRKLISGSFPTLYQSLVQTTPALVAIGQAWYPRRDSNPYGVFLRQILSLLCMPFHHSGTAGK